MMLDINKCNIIQCVDQGKELELFLAKYKGDPLRLLSVGCSMINLQQEETGEESVGPTRRLLPCSGQEVKVSCHKMNSGDRKKRSGWR